MNNRQNNQADTQRDSANQKINSTTRVQQDQGQGERESVSAGRNGQGAEQGNRNPQRHEGADRDKTDQGSRVRASGQVNSDVASNR